MAEATSSLTVWPRALALKRRKNEKGKSRDSRFLSVLLTGQFESNEQATLLAKWRLYPTVGELIGCWLDVSIRLFLFLFLFFFLSEKSVTRKHVTPIKACSGPRAQLAPLLRPCKRALAPCLPFSGTKSTTHDDIGQQLPAIDAIRKTTTYQSESIYLWKQTRHLKK